MWQLRGAAIPPIVRSVGRRHKPPRRNTGEGGPSDLAVLESRCALAIGPGWHHSCTAVPIGPHVRKAFNCIEH